MTRAHFDTVLMIVTGRVIPFEEVKASNVKTIGGEEPGPTQGLYETLAKMLGRPVYTHELPAALMVAGAYFLKEYPEIPADADFPLLYDAYTEWRASFLTEHDLPDWYDLPIIDANAGAVLKGSTVDFIHDDGTRTTVTI